MTLLSEEGKELLEKQEAIRVVKEVEQRSHNIIKIGRDYLDRVVVRLKERQEELLNFIDGKVVKDIGYYRKHPIEFKHDFGGELININER